MLCAPSTANLARNARPLDCLGAVRAVLPPAARVGGGLHGHSRRVSHGAARELSLPGEIARGIAQDEFYPLYQPIARTQDGRIVSAEVLCRWQRPDGREVSPARVITSAEQSGLIVALDNRLMFAAFDQLRRWTDEGRHLGLSVNLSGHQFRDHNLVRRLSGMTRAAGVRPSDVQLEITETALVAHRRTAARAMHALRALGFRIALDDFGQGYSNLGYLQDFPVDTIKIDRSFLKGISAGSRGRAIVRSVAAMARDVGAQTVIEGVETPDELRAVRELGITYYQGFLLGCPDTAEALMVAAAVRERPEGPAS